MKESVKRTASRDETEMVWVQGSTEAEGSSHQTRKRCRKAKIGEGSSDQPQEGGGKAKVIDGSSDQAQEGGGKAKFIDGSSDQTQKRGRKVKLTSDELKARRAVRDSNRHKNLMEAKRKVKEMGPQMEILEKEKADLERKFETQKNETKEVRVELEKINSELLLAFTQRLDKVTEQLEIVKNDNKEKRCLIDKFLQNKLKENDGEIPIDYDYLDGKENWSSEGIPNVENLMTDLEYPPEMFDLVGMPWKEFEDFKRQYERRCEELEKENVRRYEELKKESERRYEELKREDKRRYEELKREDRRRYEELKSEIKELKREKEELKRENKRRYEELKSEIKELKREKEELKRENKRLQL